MIKPLTTILNECSNMSPQLCHGMFHSLILSGSDNKQISNVSVFCKASKSEKVVLIR